MAASSEKIVLQMSHVFEIDTDRCKCGGLVVWFEDGDKFGEIGHGCDNAVVVFSDKQTREHGH